MGSGCRSATRVATERHPAHMMQTISSASLSDLSIYFEIASGHADDVSLSKGQIRASGEVLDASQGLLMIRSSPSLPLDGNFIIARSSFSNAGVRSLHAATLLYSPCAHLPIVRDESCLLTLHRRPSLSTCTPSRRGCDRLALPTEKLQFVASWPQATDAPCLYRALLIVKHRIYPDSPAARRHARLDPVHSAHSTIPIKSRWLLNPPSPVTLANADGAPPPPKHNLQI
jgi:hypothetical protein